jgi:hypothetical protein
MKTLLLAAFSVATLLIAGSPHKWQVGTLTETAYRSQTVGGGPVAIAHSSSGQSSNPSVEAAGQYATAAAITANRARTYTWQGFTINGGGYVYIVMCPVGRHKPNVTVNGPVKYAFEKGKFYIQDEDGKEFSMTVLSKTIPVAVTPAAP